MQFKKYHRLPQRVKSTASQIFHSILQQQKKLNISVKYCCVAHTFSQFNNSKKYTCCTYDYVDINMSEIMLDFIYDTNDNKHST